MMLFILILCLTQLHSKSIESQLASIDKTIRAKSSSIINLPLHKKYSLKFEGQQDIVLHESPKIPARKEGSYPLLFQIDNKFYNIAGQEVFSLDPPYFISSIRNDVTFVAKQQNSTTWLIQQLEVQGRHGFLKPFTNITVLCTVTLFGSSMSKGKRIFVFGTDQGELLLYDKNGIYERKINVSSSSIVQMLKYSSYLYVRSERDLAYLSLNHDQPPIYCQRPAYSIMQLKSAPDNSHNRLYVVTTHGVYVYQPAPSCKPLHFIETAPNSSVTFLSDLLLIHDSLSTLAYNLTQNKPYFVQIFKKFQGSFEIIGFKKAQYMYGMLTIVRNQETILTFYDYQDTARDYDTSINLKGFKAPIFLLSVGIVFYFSFKGKKGKKDEDEDLQSLLSATQKKDLKVGNRLTEEEFRELVTSLSKKRQ